MEMNAIEARLYQVELENNKLALALASVRNLATQAAQNAGMGGGGASAAGNSSGWKLAYFPYGIGGLVGNQPGNGPFQFVTTQVNSMTSVLEMVGTGDTADSSLAFNLSSLGSSNPAYGYVFQSDGLWWGLVDCGNGATAPTQPTNTVVTVTTIGGGGASPFMLSTGAALLTN
jgi:hypothetical protein